MDRSGHTRAATAAHAIGGAVRREIVDGIGWVIFNRPQAANAANPPMMRDLCDAIDIFAADPEVRALVLRGEGRHFLAGGDLDWLSDITEGRAQGAADEIYHWFQGATRRLMGCAKPTIAAVSGAAFTVGAELAMACDVRLVDRTAYFAETWLDIGLVAPLGGAMWLPRLVGVTKAKEILLECRRVGAQEAVAIGLANAMFESSEDLYAGAQKRAVAMAARPAGAFARMKQLIHGGMQVTCDEGWNAGIQAQAECLESPDFKAAVRDRLIARRE